ncbi:hypothetical protein O9A_01365 [Bartonella koehlerae C-29]|uniref:Uncharacterized protein n=1 Tax=Bartonella koehlerae C-29 TaxID=1134510 RepID=A0A067W7C2_9HYPH|nr:hypothetical protein O9A_01365 [Bartonella koehlerae C-29]
MYGEIICLHLQVRIEYYVIFIISWWFNLLLFEKIIVFSSGLVIYFICLHIKFLELKV